MKSLYTISLLFVVVIVGVTHATSRDLPGIDLIERDQRGADESRKRWNDGAYLASLKDASYQTLWVGGGKAETLYEDSELLEEAMQRGEAIEEVLSELYPDYYPRIFFDYQEQGNTLTRPRKYTNTKNSITIHHTADTNTYRFPSDGQSGLQEVYRQHTVVRGRGDIGYNFLIDPQGRIYEGRSGGQGVIAGHANLRNNITSIGVSLLGNFEITKPTSAALESLTQLNTILAYQYSITPDDVISVFNRGEEDPLEIHEHDHAIMGHRDVKSTACPGTYLYSKIPALTAEVGRRLQRLDRVSGGVVQDENFLVLPRTVRNQDNQGGVTIPRGGSIRRADCETFDGKSRLRECRVVLGGVRLVLEYDEAGSSGIKTIGIETDRGWKMVTFSMLRNTDLQSQAMQLKSEGEVLPAKSPNTKIQDAISQQQARELLGQDVSVLLYEATRQGELTTTCVGGCEVVVAGNRIANAKTIIVRQEANRIVSFVDLVRYESDDVVVKGSDGGVVSLGSPEGVVGGVLSRTYHGKLTFAIDTWRDLDHGWRESMTVVNRLSLLNYLRGMGESSETQHIEKTKTLALLTKMYALFYSSGKNPHPSIPDDASYTAIDDPRSFQRYIGVGAELLSPNRLQAIDATFDQLVLYDGYVPILPYYHCSGGFTRSGREKFGRTDTPWLQSKLDVVACELGGFEGHGVGMSGDGAEYLAQAGASAKEILKWYYEGVEVGE